MGASSTYIEISPSRVSVCSGGRRSATTSSQVISRDEWDAWHNGASRSIEERIEAMLGKPGRTKGATVFYHSPTLSCNLYSCPSSIKDMTAAAHLALSELSALNLEENPWCIQPIAADRSGSPKRSHLLIAADTEQSVRRAKSLARSNSGTRLVPLEAALIATSVNTALRQSRGEHPVVVVHFGQNRSVIAAAHQRQLLLVRRVDVGTDRLIEALASASGLGKNEAIALADRLMFETGLPAPGQTVTVGEREFTAADILPAIQPVLQRLVVEIRQSIRFGLSGQQAAPTILLQGSGATIKRLAQAFERELEIACVADESRPAELCTDIAFAIDAVEQGLSLSLREQQDTARAAANASRLALYAGTAAAITLGVGFGLWTIDQTRKLEPQISQFAGAQTELADSDNDPLRDSAFVSSVRKTIKSIDHFVGKETDVASAVREICLLTAEEAVLTDIEFNGGREHTSCRLRGYLRNPGGDAAEQIRSLVDQLRESPLIESVRLDGTELATLDEKPTQYFAASIVLAATPPQILPNPATLASVETEQAP